MKGQKSPPKEPAIQVRTPLRTPTDDQDAKFWFEKRPEFTCQYDECGLIFTSQVHIWLNFWQNIGIAEKLALDFGTIETIFMDTSDIGA